MNRWLRLGQLARSSKGKRAGAGYTITEVLIVLSVTTLMFIFIATAFMGRQRRAEFNQSVRNFEAMLQTIISETANGSYQSSKECTIFGGQPRLSSVTKQPGTNKDCIFLGKVIAGRQSQAEVFTVLGSRLNSTSADVASLAEAAPRAMVLGGAPPNDVDLTAEIPFSYGLQIRAIYGMTAGGGNGPTYRSFGFLHQLGGGAALTSPLSGSRSVLLYGVEGASPIQDTDLARTGAADVTGPNLRLLPNGLRICLGGADATRDQRAEITIGENNSQTTINVLVDTGTTGVCGSV
ncbi:MAG: hypothetical protein WAQ57_00040 [Candidatus Saccharimonadales bacterium]